MRGQFMATCPRSQTASLLRLKSFCTVEAEKKANVVVQLSTSEGEKSHELLYRYVLVVDVSSTMGSAKHEHKGSLLERVKAFAESLVDVLDETSWLSIVKFTREAKVCLRMTRMNKTGQRLAKEALRSLQAGQGRSIRRGLLQGLQTTALRSNMTNFATRIPEKSRYRDCILLLTDAKVTGGMHKANELVSDYNKLLKELEKTTRVPVSTFTMGNYKPLILPTISAHLGCEAFYWLNDNCEFEADMFTPISLRDKVFASDISVTFTGLNGTTFPVKDISCRFLETKEPSAPVKELSYFIHYLPAKTNKNIPLVLTISENFQLKGKNILKTTVKYFDYQMRQHEETHFLELNLTALHHISTHYKKQSSKEALAILRDTSAYSVTSNNVDHTWRGAEEAYAKVCQEKSRKVAALALHDCCKILKSTHPDDKAITAELTEAINKIEESQLSLLTVLGKENYFARKATFQMEEMKERLAFGKTVAKDKNMCQFVSMESAIWAESPPANGTFDSTKLPPYMTTHAARKQENYRKTLKAIEKKKKETEFEDSSKPSKPMNLALSERLLNVETGIKKQTYEEHIIRLGGTAVPHVGTFMCNTILICTKEDFKRKTLRVRDALNSKVPIVALQFLKDSVKQGKMLPINDYLIAN